MLYATNIAHGFTCHMTIWHSFTGFDAMKGLMTLLLCEVLFINKIKANSQTNPDEVLDSRTNVFFSSCSNAVIPKSECHTARRQTIPQA